MVSLWSSLGVTALFTLLLVIWWGVLTDGGDHAKFNRSGPTGIVCITAVFIVLLWFNYN